MRKKSNMPKITFIYPDGQELLVDAQAGLSIPEIAHELQVPIPGVCEGSMRCSTCHVIVGKEHYDKLDPISAEEENILDNAFGLTATSRLGCQIIMCDELDGMRITLPEATTNLLD